MANEATFEGPWESVPKGLSSYIPELPITTGEITFLFINALMLVGICYGVRRHFSKNNETMPPQLAVGMCVGMFFYYLWATQHLYFQATLLHRITVLYACGFFWLFPGIYYGLVALDAITSSTVDNIGPFSGHIEEPSAFSEARKMALRGNIDGAVKVYRSYNDKNPIAFFEAARLLRSQGRHAEAAGLFEEISERFNSKHRVWAEARYQLAKLKERNLNDPAGAASHYMEIIERAPDTRFCQLAVTDIARLREHVVPSETELNDEEDEVLYGRIAPPSDKKIEELPGLAPSEKSTKQEADPVPDGDPFYLMRIGKPLPESKKPSAPKKKKAKAKTKAKPKATAKSKAKPKSKATAKLKAKPKTKVKAKVASKTKAKPKAKRRVKAQPKTKAKAKAKASRKTAARK